MPNIDITSFRAFHVIVYLIHSSNFSGVLYYLTLVKINDFASGIFLSLGSFIVGLIKIIYQYIINHLSEKNNKKSFQLLP